MPNSTSKSPPLTYNDNLTGTTVMLPRPSPPTMRELVEVPVTPSMQPKSSIATLKKELESGKMPEEIMAEATSVPYSRVRVPSASELRVEALTTGFRLLDRNRFLKKNRPNVAMVAAHSGHGKTALLMQIAMEVAKEGPVFVHSFEMDNRDLTTRMIATFGGCTAEEIMDGSADQEWLNDCGAQLADRKLHLCDVPSSSIGFLKQSLLDASQKFGRPALIVLDYVQMIESDKQGAEWEVLKPIMRELQMIAARFQTNVLIGCQLNNRILAEAEDDEGGQKYRPKPNHLAGGKKTLDACDSVMVIVRPELFDGSRPREADIFCLKNRGGEVFEGTWGWVGQYTKFIERK